MSEVILEIRFEEAATDSSVDGLETCIKLSKRFSSANQLSLLNLQTDQLIHNFCNQFAYLQGQADTLELVGADGHILADNLRVREKFPKGRAHLLQLRPKTGSVMHYDPVSNRRKGIAEPSNKSPLLLNKSETRSDDSTPLTQNEAQMIVEDEEVFCEDCFKDLYLYSDLDYQCKTCDTSVCRLCTSRVDKWWHYDFWNIFGCPRPFLSDMRSLTQIFWSLFYILLVPFLAMRYAMIQMVAPMYHCEYRFRSSTVGKVSWAGYAGLASLFLPVWYILVLASSLLYRVWMLLYMTYSLCMYRSKHAKLSVLVDH